MPPGNFFTSSKLLEPVSVGSLPTENSNSTSSDQLIDVLSEVIIATEKYEMSENLEAQLKKQ
ncbi:14961_t:CDS:2 [Cetraspora pellucida]|uniref:14961_t:CDS:1 n=1 Tax=Cetraspora pellucida TaxID=1433469 RepID=A0ACA9JYD0_9GLOM|nr:14961_t:CDS:2 [Cetraspora pellucida]